MKENEIIWTIVAIVFLIISIFLIYFFGVKILGVVHVFIVVSVVAIYSTIASQRIRKLEKICPKKGEECYCYIIEIKQGDNGSVIYKVVAHLESENVNKEARYQSFVNTKLKSGKVVKGYYYKGKVVLENNNIDIKNLPQNVFDAFELSNENPLY